MRAGDTIVDCSEASDEVRMAIDMRIANGPITCGASTAKIDSWLSGLPAPSSPVPTPAHIRVATVTSR